MGIRYYAYAFDASLTEQALAAPEVFISRDPLADAWGLPHGWRSGEMQGQLLSRSELLYLDKAWPLLQRATGPAMFGDPARPAFRMFEGSPRFHENGSHDAWVRTIVPSEVVAIADDLASITDAEIVRALTARVWGVAASDSEVEYATTYLHDARDFALQLAANGRGFVYAIR
jgi:hypothetical protein